MPLIASMDENMIRLARLRDGAEGWRQTTSPGAQDEQEGTNDVRQRSQYAERHKDCEDSLTEALERGV